MSEKENRTESITFRISPTYKKWLDELVKESEVSSPSEYLNGQIRLRRRSLILDKAMDESKLSAGKELGLTEKMSNAIDGPEDIKAFFKAFVDEEKAQKHNKRWFDEFNQNAKKGASDIGMHDIANYLSTDKGNALLEFFFNNYVAIRKLNSLSDESEDLATKPKKGGKNAESV